MVSRTDRPIPLPNLPTPSSSEASAARLDADVIVAGAGAIGLTLAIALAQAGLEVVVAGRIATRMPGRTVALLEGSVRLLESLGLWAGLTTRSAPLRTMRLIDDSGSLFRIPPVNFRAEEIGKPWFGCNIENGDLVEGLATAARQQRGLTLHRSASARICLRPRLRLRPGSRTKRDWSAAVLVAADGRRSPARNAAGLKVRTWRYPQVALTAILRHARSHHDVSAEFHTRQGPFTLVPLPGSPAAPHRSSLVWVMSPDEARRRAALDPADLARAIERQSRMVLGRIEIEGECGCFSDLRHDQRTHGRNPDRARR